jgi:ribosomal protein S12 methylthiotransferase accessory factor
MSPLELTQVLALNPCLRLQRVGTRTAFFIGEHQRFLLSGEGAAEVASLVDGRRTVRDILEDARPRVSELEALGTLHRLLEARHVVAADGDVPLASAAFWHGAGLDAGVALDALRRASVSVTALGTPVPSGWMADALAQAGVRVAEGAALRVVVTDDYLRTELAEIDAQARETCTPWCLVKPSGVQALIGPIFEPGSGPCWECLAFWIRSNRPVEELVRRHCLSSGPVSPPVANVEAGARAACSLTALAVARALAEMRLSARNSRQGEVVALDLSSLQTTTHAVVKRPQCQGCGEPRLMAAVGERSVRLRPTEKAHCEDGGYRRQSPRQTYERYRHLVSPLTGAVTHLVAMPGRDTELRAVYASGYSVCPREAVPSANVFDKPCAGKGRGAEQARASALCEALERYSGVFQGDEARIRSSRADLGPAAVSLGELLNFSDAQYVGRDPTTDVRADLRQWVPAPLDAHTPIDWTPAWSLSRDTRRYVPLAYCYAEVPAESGTAFCRPCGNGVAAGTCVEEALLQALLELFERDAAAVWWYNRLRRPAVDLSSFCDPYFDALEADYRRHGWEVWVLDLTHDLRIPTCVALANDPRSDRFAIGFGCHIEARIAVQRALTELNQIFDPGSARPAPWDVDLLRSREHLFPDRSRSLVRSHEFDAFRGSDLRADVEYCMAMLDEAGLELIAVDKSRPDIGLRVIQAIVPGLRHFWPRFGRGRLYDVPVALGWLARPLDEGELNPSPLLV